MAFGLATGIIMIWALTGDPCFAGRATRMRRSSQMNQRLASLLIGQTSMFLCRKLQAALHFEVWAYQVNPQEVSVGDPNLIYPNASIGNQMMQLS